MRFLETLVFELSTDFSTFSTGLFRNPHLKSGKLSARKTMRLFSVLFNMKILRKNKP